MVCIWATSLEISWGIIALRMIVKNVQDWVHARVKPEISRWIQDVYRNRRRISSLTPSGDVVTQRRRATSCGLSNEIVNLKKPVSPISKGCHRSPRQKRPSLPHGKTAPEPRDGRREKASIPQVRLNGLSEPNGDDIDDSSDEGYGSVHTRSEDESEEEEEEEEEKSLHAFICNDEPSEDDSDASYVPPSSEDNSTGSESDESSDASAEDSSDEEEYTLSDSERHGHWLKQQSRAISRPAVYCTPTKGHKLSAPLESRARRERRRSSRF